MSPAIVIPFAATAVVDGYEVRARFARADARPRFLLGYGGPSDIAAQAGGGDAR